MKHFSSARFTVAIHVIYLTFSFLFAVLFVEPDLLTDIGAWAFGLLLATVSLYKATKGIEHSKWAAGEKPNVGV